MVKHTWTNAEIAFIMNNYQRMTVKEIGRELGVTAARVYNFLDYRGLKAFRRVYQWTDENKQFVRDHYRDMTSREIAAKLGCTIAVVKNFRWNNGLLLDAETQKQQRQKTQFPKGLIPWNKGLKVFAHPNSSQFSKGHTPANTVSEGTVTIRNNKGQRYLWIKTADGWMMLNRFLWEQANGPIPKGMLIAFIDGDAMNCVLENLKLISMGDNARRNIRRTRNRDSDKFYAKKIWGGKWRAGLKKHPELVELKRKEIELQRLLKNTKKRSANYAIG